MNRFPPHYTDIPKRRERTDDEIKDAQLDREDACAHRLIIQGKCKWCGKFINFKTDKNKNTEIE